MTEIDIYRSSDVSKRKKADYVTAQVIVAGASQIAGPVSRLDLDGANRFASGSRMRVDRKTGTVTASLALTLRQQRALAAQMWAGRTPRAMAARIRVLFRHYRDADPTRAIHEDIASVGARARWGGSPLALPGGPGAVLLQGAGGQVRLTNTTSNPLVVMAGPTSCMYDSIYEYGGSGPQSGWNGSHLGTMNGNILAPGQSIQAYVESDTSVLDGREDNASGTTVLADYTEFQNDALQAAQDAATSTLPELDIPSGDDDGPWKDIDESLGFFSLDVVRNLLSEDGVWATYAAASAQSAGIPESELGTFDTALEFADGLLDYAEPITGLVEGLVALFSNGCNAHDGYIMIGATDQNHPWRQFAQVYDWGKGSPYIPKSGTTTFGSHANGLVANVVTPLPAAQQPAFDDPAAANVPTNSGGVAQWQFTETTNQVNTPAKVSLDAGTRRVHCNPADAGSDQPPAGLPTVISSLAMLPSYVDYQGNSVTKPSVGPNDYLVGEHFIAGGSTRSVRYSADGISWTSVPIPAGQDYYDLPEGSEVTLVACDTQAAELLTRATLSGRTVLMGTRVPSDVIPGPDYYGTPATPPAMIGPLGTATPVPGPTGVTRGLVAVANGLWWIDGNNQLGHRNLATGKVSRFPVRNTSQLVAGPDGNLWMAGSIPSGSTALPALVKFDPRTWQLTRYQIGSTAGTVSNLAVGPDGNLWFAASGATLGRFNLASMTPTLFPGVLDAGPYDVVAGPDGNLWVSSFTQVDVYNTAGTLIAVGSPFPPGQLGSLAAGPDGRMWVINNGDPSHDIAPSVAVFDLSQFTLTPQGVKVCFPIGSGCTVSFAIPSGMTNLTAATFGTDGSLWFGGMTGTNSGDFRMVRMNAATGATDLFAFPYRLGATAVTGPDGQIYLGGDDFDYRIWAFSTGVSPATSSPQISGQPRLNNLIECTGGTWPTGATGQSLSWRDATTGRMLEGSWTSAYVLPLNDPRLVGHYVQCVQTAALPWVGVPLSAVSTPVKVQD
ncbi:Vgb family protein [Methylolobus aquaticus]